MPRPLSLDLRPTYALASLVDGQGGDVRVNGRDIVGRDEEVKVGKGDEHGAVDGRVVLPRRHVGLDGVGGAVLEANVLQRRIGDVKLRQPGGELGRLHVSSSNVAVIRADELAGRVPAEKDLTTRVRERDSTVLANSSLTVAGLVVGVNTQLVLGDVGRRQRIGVGAGRLVPHQRAVDTGWV